MYLQSRSIDHVSSREFVGCTELVATFAKKSELVERVKVLRKEAKSVSYPPFEFLNTLHHCHMRSACLHSYG
jgi:hypothetical protein